MTTTKTHKFQYDSIYGTDDPNLQHDAMAGYYGSITHVDHQIGRILLALHKDGILDIRSYALSVIMVKCYLIMVYGERSFHTRAVFIFHFCRACRKK